MLSFKLWQSNQYRHRLKYKTTHQYLNYFLTSIHIKADMLKCVVSPCWQTTSSSSPALSFHKQTPLFLKIEIICKTTILGKSGLEQLRKLGRYPFYQKSNVKLLIFRTHVYLTIEWYKTTHKTDVKQLLANVAIIHSKQFS